MTLAAACLTATALAACSTSTSGTPTAAGTSSSGTSSSGTSSSGSAAGYPTDVTALAAAMRHALGSTTSVHLVITISVAGQSVTGEGDQTIENGRSKDSSLTLNVPGSGTERLVTVDGRTYVQLPSAQRTSPKPWALVTPESSNPAVRILAQSLRSSSAFSGTDAAYAFVSAAGSLTSLGTQRLSDGTQAAHYRLDVVTARLPATYPSRTVLQRLGITRLPVDLWVDDQGNVRQFQQTVHIANVRSTSQVRLSDFNAPVTISAPPADEVAVR